jgi:hypothetical protein
VKESRPHPSNQADMKHRRLRRLLFGASLAAAAIGPGLVMATQPAHADNCVQARLYINGAVTHVGPNCGVDGGDICVAADPVVGNPNLGLGATGAGATVCVLPPVMN